MAVSREGARGTAALLAAAGTLAVATAAAQPIDLGKLDGAASSEQRLEEVSGDLRESFEQALARYDDELAARPWDVAGRIAQCQFIDDFASTYEYVEWSDELYDRADECAAALEERFAEHPEFVLWQLGREYDDEKVVSTCEDVLASTTRQAWTAGQLARLYTLFANATDRLDEERSNVGKTAELAREALKLDELADVRVLLASALLERGERTAALEVLASPFDGHSADDNAYRVRKMALYADLGERDAVLRLHTELAAHDAYYDHTEAAYALRAVGARELAEQELDAQSDRPYTAADERARFFVAFESGTEDEALAAYNAWRDTGWEADPLGINRLALFGRYPSLPWAPRDWQGLVGLLGGLCALGLALLVPIGLVHYRGLAVRARTGTAYPTAGWALRHAWLALAAIVGAGVLSLYTVGPVDLFGEDGSAWARFEPPQLSRMLITESLIALMLLVPLGVAARRLQPGWWGRAWPLYKSALAGVGLALLFRAPLLLVLMVAPDARHSVQFDSDVWRSLEAVDERYGILAAVWVLAVAAPVTEEFVFRGVLLRAFSGHLAFGTANVLQAALFAGAHLDLAAAPYLFALGLVAGWLARRSDGLVAPMVLHGTFNLVVAVLLGA
ncbi:MAG TPA: CPBP family intramembrane glutamic endopeptidase [Gammaproteobacteria bacterium]|nr:CPBP family intramembrane glutamic endopeptidase [Gammaproteobacteria bacterium]